MVRILGFHCHGPGSIPGQGAEIVQAAWFSQKKKKKRLKKHIGVSSHPSQGQAHSHIKWSMEQPENDHRILKL